MLIWKVIAANPGITREEIWKQVEHGIPDGYAKRLYARCELKSIADPGAIDLGRARSFILTLRLQNMRTMKHVTWEGGGKDRRYTAATQPVYRGNADAIDETGTKAAEHMALADALRIAEKMLARGKPGNRSGPVVCANRREYEAVSLLVRALRAKGPA
jgi:hypothetical protein